MTQWVNSFCQSDLHIYIYVYIYINVYVLVKWVISFELWLVDCFPPSQNIWTNVAAPLLWPISIKHIFCWHKHYIYHMLDLVEHLNLKLLWLVLCLLMNAAAWWINAISAAHVHDSCPWFWHHIYCLHDKKDMSGFLKNWYFQIVITVVLYYIFPYVVYSNSYFFFPFTPEPISETIFHL